MTPAPLDGRCGLVTRASRGIGRAITIGLARVGVAVVASVRDVSGDGHRALHADEPMEFCRARLASYKKPTSVDFHADLPRSDTGKILRRTLQEPCWTGCDRRIY
jgi:acyl-coenzyme A synthetase/AMP-(fatty) acid ligase